MDVIDKVEYDLENGMNLMEVMCINEDVDSSNLREILEGIEERYYEKEGECMEFYCVELVSDIEEKKLLRDIGLERMDCIDVVKEDFDCLWKFIY